MVVDLDLEEEEYIFLLDMVEPVEVAGMVDQDLFQIVLVMMIVVVEVDQDLFGLLLLLLMFRQAIR